jgi:hypothetical protein
MEGSVFRRWLIGNGMEEPTERWGFAITMFTPPRPMPRSAADDTK